MSFTEDEEILQDFLVEAGEILERLNEELVDLENRPDDNELLNSVFRGFHTIKGGASFLSLTGVVEVCHRSEDVFNLLRNNELTVTSSLMDCILPVLDVLNDQFAALNGGTEPESADAALLAALDQIIKSAEDGGNQEVEAVVETTPETAAVDDVDAEFEAFAGESDSKTENEEITDDEFENLLDQLHGSGLPIGKDKQEAKKEVSKKAEAKESNSDVITDDEFENLLDQLHGSGAPKKVAETKAASVAAEKPADMSANISANMTKASTDTGSGDEFSDDEFEALLDNIHGKTSPGKTQTAAASEPVKAAPAPAKKVVEKPKPAAKAQTKTPAKKEMAETTVRVDTSRLDEIMNLVGELVLVRNRISRLEQSIENEELEKVVANFDLVTTDLQNAVMKTRMQPIKKVFGRFPRVIRDLARSLNKKVNLVLEGEDTDLDKNLVEALADPLVHLVRNSVDHGIELPEIRKKAGKDETGTVTLAASQEGDHINLVIKDDGAGIDPEKLKQLAIGKGVIDAETAERLSDKDAFNLIFMAGFSTKEAISDISGRGVGMDVVKNAIAQLNGVIEIDSVIGKGSTLTIKVPLTLAIMPTLMIMLDKYIFALPLVNVGEILSLDLRETNMVDGQEVIMLRDKAVPIYYLRNWLVKNSMKSEHLEEEHVVIVSIGTQKIGFVVDLLLGQEEVVIKPLGSTLSATRGFAGATITGDGDIALILDVPELINTYARSY